MGLFKKKRDPLDERAKDLKRQIGALEDEIRRLSTKQAGSRSNGHSNVDAVGHSPLSASKAIPSFGHPTETRPSVQPRGAVLLESTVMDASSPSSSDPIFEDVKQNPFRPSGAAPKSNGQELGIRRDDLASSWQRFKNHFRGPVTSNPKLVNYLAAGSIQGLQPLRYEKRVARNRFIALVAILVLILWGALALLLKR